MAKGRYTIVLDAEAHRIVSQHLRTCGMSFSGFLNGILCEVAKEIQGQPVMLDKNLSDLTLKEFGELSAYWMKITTDPDEEAKK